GPSAIGSHAASPSLEPPNRALRKRPCAAGDGFCSASSAHENRSRRSHVAGFRGGWMRRRSPDSDGHTHSNGYLERSEPFNHRCAHGSVVNRLENEPGFLSGARLFFQQSSYFQQSMSLLSSDSHLEISHRLTGTGRNGSFR